MDFISGDVFFIQISFGRFPKIAAVNAVEIRVLDYFNRSIGVTDRVPIDQGALARGWGFHIFGADRQAWDDQYRGNSQGSDCSNHNPNQACPALLCLFLCRKASLRLTFFSAGWADLVINILLTQ